MDIRYEKEMGTVRKLCEVTLRGNIASLVEFLDKHPLLLHEFDNCDPESPLHIASMLGHIDFAREILSRNRELALELDSRGHLPLHLSSTKGYVEIVKMLLDIEPQHTCKLRDEMGRTPLHLAVMKGKDEVIKELLRANMESIQILTHQGETVLHLAVIHKRFGYSKSIDGNAILHLAVANKQTETIRYLVGGSIMGVDLNVSNKNGFTPLDVSLAVQRRYDIRDMEILKLLAQNKCRRGLVQIVTTKTDGNNYSKSKRGMDDWVNDVRRGLMVVASLIATVAFEAGLTPAVIQRKH